MDTSINTHYRGRGFATSDPLILDETRRTRTVFDPGVHGGGVRGRIIRQKIGSDGAWKSTNEVNFNSLAPDCGVSIELDTAATLQLYDRLSVLYQIQKQGIEFGHQAYVVAKDGQVIVLDDTTKTQAIQALLQSGYTEEFWATVVKNQPDLATQLASARIQTDREHSIANFEESLISHPHDELYWQRFFEDRPWMLQSAFSAPVFQLNGETYVGGKTSRGRQGTGGVATDFLFADESTKSFSVVEIKTPDGHLTGSRYRGNKKSGNNLDNETYSMHSNLSGAVVQVRNQIAVAIDDFQNLLGRDYSAIKLNHVHPKGVLVIGSTKDLTPRQVDSFNHFRQGLHGITVVTFNELLRRLQLLFLPDPAVNDW